MARKGKRKTVREDELAPGIAKGLTQGVPLEEVLELHPIQQQSGVELVRHMRDADKRTLRRDGVAPYAPFVGADSTQAVWSDGVTDRAQLDVNKTYTAEGLRLLREGRQCLRCDEPQPESFPLACDLCGYAMKERQIMDIAMEFEGEKHLGPSRPITEYMQEVESRTEKRRFIDRVIEGGSGRIPKEWLRDATLFPNGVPKQLA